MPRIDPLALYGAILGTLGTVLGLWQLRVDRPRLEFRVDPDYPDRADDWEKSGDMGPAYVRVRVLNKGRRPIPVTRVGLLLRLDLTHASDPVLHPWTKRIEAWSGSQTLNEAEFIEGAVLEDDIIGTAVYFPQGPYKVRGVFAVDASGKMHTKPVGAPWRRLGHEEYRSHLPERPTRTQLDVMWLRLRAGHAAVLARLRPDD